MSDRNRSSYPHLGERELTELSLERSPADAMNRSWYAAALVAGVLLVGVLGFATDIFDSGPTSSDVSAAYREGVDQGTAAAEDYWQAEIVEQWWEGFKRGQASETSMAPAIVRAVREGFSWEAGYEAGLESTDIDIDSRYWQGWLEGHAVGWAAVTGEIAAAPFAPAPPGPGYTRRVQGVEWGGEP